MKRAVKWLRRGAFGLGIAVALAFGGYQAFANPTALEKPCDWIPPDFGPCDTQQQCQDRCDNYYGSGTHLGFCEYAPPPIDDVCCICIEL